MIHRSSQTNLSIDHPSGPRFELALQRFVEGAYFDFRGTAFRLAEDSVVECFLDSTWHTENITTATALKDLSVAKATFQELVELSDAFAVMVREKRIRFELVENYGMGSILICSQLDDNEIVWERGFPRSNS